MYSINGSDRLAAAHDRTSTSPTDPNTDLILSQMRVDPGQSAAASDVAQFGVTVRKRSPPPSSSSPCTAPRHLRQHLSRQLRLHQSQRRADRVPGIASVTVFGAGQYALRASGQARREQLAKLTFHRGEGDFSDPSATRSIRPAKSAPSHRPRGRTSPYSVRAQGRLTSPEGILAGSVDPGKFGRRSTVR